MQDFNGIKFHQSGDKNAPVIMWGHGWGQSGHGFAALEEPLRGMGQHIRLDFPGFGESPPPPEPWGSEDYADHVATLIKSVSDQPIIWVGHSFGCRVGLQLAVKYPELIKGMCLIAGAGIPRKLPFFKSLYFKFRIRLYKSLKAMIPLGLSEDWLKSKFGSTDYRDADPVMRNILVKVVNEDLSNIASDITCPTLLVYGENDTETPPSIGRTLSGLISEAKFVLLDNQDHYSVLASGRHQVLKHLKAFIKDL